MDGVRRRRGPNIVEKEPEAVKNVHRSIGFVSELIYNLIFIFIQYSLTHSHTMTASDAPEKQAF